MKTVKILKLKTLNMIITEKMIKDQVKSYLDLMGYFHFPLTQGFASYPGLPDRIAVNQKGQVYFIECKRPVGSIHSKVQIKFQQNIERQHGNYLLVHNLEELIEGLK